MLPGTVEAMWEELSTTEYNEEEKRCAVTMALTNTKGMATNRDIADMLGVQIRVVQLIRERLNSGENPRDVIQRKKRAEGSRRTSRTEDFIKRVEARILEEPSMSMQALAKEFDVDRKTISRCIQQDLRCRSYRLQTGQFLSEAMKDRRLKKSKILHNKLKHPKEENMLWFFSDEKNFCQDQEFNRQNNRWIAMRPKDVPKIMQTKFPATVMVFGVISSEGHVMPPHIFETGLKVNTDIYLSVMEDVVLPWIKTIAGDRPWVWQQDSAPCHVSNCSLQWLTEHTHDFVSKDAWPPSSPDLNPMDYFYWGVLEARTNRAAHNTKASLNETTSASWQAAVTRFQAAIAPW